MRMDTTSSLCPSSLNPHMGSSLNQGPFLDFRSPYKTDPKKDPNVENYRYLLSHQAAPEVGCAFCFFGSLLSFGDLASKGLPGFGVGASSRSK